MNNSTGTLEFHLYRRWWLSLPFILALVVLAFIGAVAIRALPNPHDGISNLHPSGVVGEIEASGPTNDKLKVGDIILFVDGVDFSEAFPLIANKRAGETVHLIVERDENIIPVTFTLVEPPLDTILKRLAPLLVALVFWVVGISIQAFLPSNRDTNIFFLFCLSSSLLLSAGLVSAVGPLWTATLFNLLIWFIGPLAVHFHLHFPQTTLTKWRRLIAGILYGLASIGGFPYLIWGPLAVRTFHWYKYLLLSSRFLLALNLLTVVGLLFYTYQHATSGGTRSKIRIVVMGGALSLLPFVTLTILPDALLQQPIIPYAYAFLFLAVLPLTYGYAIFRHRLIEIEKHINRGATYIVVYSLLAGFYLLLYAGLNQLLPASAAVNAFLVLVLATMFMPLQNRVQKIVDTAFYGGWYDYRSAVTNITQDLGQKRDLKSLARVISERLVKTLRIEDVIVFFKDLDGTFSVIEVAPQEKIGDKGPIELSPLPKKSLRYLLNIGDVERSSLREALSEVAFTPEEQQLLNTEQIHLWVPILGHGHTVGLLALGPKYGGDIFSGEDLDILRVISRQIGPLIENIHLLNRLRRYASQLEQRVEERTAELHAAKERVEAILASVAEGVVVTDLDGRILTVNSALESQSGYTSSEVIGRQIEILISEKSSQNIDEMHATLSDGEVWSGELVNQSKDDALYDVHLTIAPVRDQNGQVMGYVGSQRDITNQKELDRLKDQFVSDVSHELRTPVTTIGLYLELLEQVGPEKKKEYIDILHGEVNQLRRLIEDVLDLSRLDIGKSRQAKFKDTDLNLVVEQSVIAHRPLAESAGLDLRFDPQLDLQSIRGEPNQLARVISNLLSNAIRYTSSGWIHVRTFNCHHNINGHEGETVCVQVQDTGMGISGQDIPHIFERFYRGRDVSQAKFPGTGLGLAIAKEIVDMHSGSIDLHTKTNKGTIFRVFLPVLE